MLHSTRWSPTFVKLDFSVAPVVKSKYRIKISVEQGMRVVMFDPIPSFGDLCSAQQAHIPLVSSCGYLGAK